MVAVLQLWFATNLAPGWYSMGGGGLEGEKKKWKTMWWTMGWKRRHVERDVRKLPNYLCEGGKKQRGKWERNDERLQEKEKRVRRVEEGGRRRWMEWSNEGSKTSGGRRSRRGWRWIASRGAVKAGGIYSTLSRKKKSFHMIYVSLSKKVNTIVCSRSC